MKDVFLFRKDGFLSSRLLGIVLMICTTAFGGYGQSKNARVDILRVYADEIEHWLLPANIQGDQPSYLAAFMAHPFPEPADYSVCLKDSAGQFFLELRQLDKNLWIELITRFEQKLSLDLSLEVGIYSVPVSKRFKKKMVEAFDKLSPYNVPREIIYYDGPTYDFKWIKKGERKKIHISYGLKAESYHSRFIELMIQLSGDLENRTFEEAKYIDKLK